MVNVPAEIYLTAMGIFFLVVIVLKLMEPATTAAIIIAFAGGYAIAKWFEKK